MTFSPTEQKSTRTLQKRGVRYPALRRTTIDRVGFLGFTVPKRAKTVHVTCTKGYSLQGDGPTVKWDPAFCFDRVCLNPFISSPAWNGCTSYGLDVFAGRVWRAACSRSVTGGWSSKVGSHTTTTKQYAHDSGKQKPTRQLLTCWRECYFCVLPHIQGLLLFWLDPVTFFPSSLFLVFLA